MDQFKFLVVMVLYSSQHVLYNQNNHKDIEIKILIDLLEIPRFLTAQGNVHLQPAHHQWIFSVACLTVTTRRSLHRRHSICSRLKNCTHTAWVH